MNRSNRTAVNMVTNAGGFMAPLLVNFIVTPILLKYIGVDGYGIQSLALVVSGYLAIMDLGMDIPITKFLAEDNAKEDYNSANKLLNTTFFLYLIISICGAAVIIAGREYLANKFFVIPEAQRTDAAVVFQLAAIGFALNMVTAWGRACLNGLQRYDVSNGIRIATMVASSVIGITVVYLGYGLVGFVLVRVVGYAVSATLCIAMAKKLLPYFKIKLKISRNVLMRISGYVGMGLVLRGTAFVLMGLDRTLLGTMVGVSVVAVYSIQWSVITPTVGLMGSVFAFFFPMTSELHGVGKMEKLRDIFKRTSKFLASLVFLIYPLLIIYGSVFLKLWVGESIARSAHSLLPMLAVYSMVGALTLGLVNEVAVGMGKIKAFAVYKLFAAGVLAISLFVFIRIYGLFGAGLSFLTVNIVDVAFFLFILKRYLNIPLLELLRDSYMYPLLLSLAMCVVGMAIRPHVNSWLTLTSTILFLCSCYVLLGFKIGIFGETEKKAICHFGKIFLKPLRKSEV